MADYKKLANDARKKVLEMVHRAKTSHIASNFSVLDVATVLYQNLKEKDEVVWSKGWSAAAIYYFLAQQGKIPVEDLSKFPNAPYLSLAETLVNGVHVSGGAMGHGLPVATGMAIGKKRANEEGIIYCIMSDGELNEGTTWESALLASHHKLDNLVVLIDVNKWQAMGRTNEVLNTEPLEDKWKSFGWHTHRINGHNYQQIEDVLLHSCKDGICAISPLVIICDTIKGKGVSFFEDHLLYHYKNVEDDEYKKALAE